MKKSLIIVGGRVLELLVKYPHGLTIHELTDKINHTKFEAPPMLKLWGTTTGEIIKVLQILKRMGLIQRIENKKKFKKWVAV